MGGDSAESTIYNIGCLNSIFNGLLLNGVLADYKESEKIPGELATGLEVLSLEIQAISMQSPGTDANFAISELTSFAEDIIKWLLNRVTAAMLMEHYYSFHREVVKASLLLKTDPPLKARLLGEIATILKLINRIETIRETSFVKLCIGWPMRQLGFYVAG